MTDRYCCDVRGLVNRDPDGKCYPMNKPCKEVPDEVCTAVKEAYNMGRYDIIATQHEMTTKAMEEGWAKYRTKYERTYCPENEDGTVVYCSECRLQTHCARSTLDNMKP